MTADDHELVDGLRDPLRRNVASIALITQYGPQLHARIRSLIGEAEADDVFQQVLIKIIQGVASFDSRSAFSTWCYRIATNESLDVLRARRRRPQYVELPDHIAGTFIADAALPDAPTLERLVAEAIAELPLQQRRVFEERYFHETPYAELAARFGKSEGALKANFHHAVRKVSDYFRAHLSIVSYEA